jgi:hypothetical protein
MGQEGKEDNQTTKKSGGWRTLELDGLLNRTGFLTGGIAV